MSKSTQSLTQKVAKKRFSLFWLPFKKEKSFLAFIAGALLISGIVYPYPQIAMWVGFCLAAYSAVANDSIQTIGTFISSNYDKKWWHQWLFIGTIFLGTVSVSWWIHDGDVTFQRLSSKGFAQAPTSFEFLQVAAPVVLLILTRLRMPVSTTFLLLSSFSTQSGTILKMLDKSLFGYLIAFVAAFLIWVVLSKSLKKLLEGPAHKLWSVFQWITTGILWSVWIMQDAANIAVYLPRQLNLTEFIVFASVIFFGLGYLFYLKGERIQKVVDEKTSTKDVRAATVIDLVYSIILIFFQYYSTIPMSTTWVFIGLLGGRELGIKLSELKTQKIGKTLKLIGKDILFAFIGLLISILMAVAVNPIIREEIYSLFN